MTRNTVFGPLLVVDDVFAWTLCGTGSVPEIGNGEPDAGDAAWKSWLCNATEAFWKIVEINVKIKIIFSNCKWKEFAEYFEWKQWKFCATLSHENQYNDFL